MRSVSDGVSVKGYSTPPERYSHAFPYAGNARPFGFVNSSTASY